MLLAVSNLGFSKLFEIIFNVCLCIYSDSTSQSDDNHDSPVKRERKSKRRIEDNSDEEEYEEKKEVNSPLENCDSSLVVASDAAFCKEKAPRTPPKRTTGNELYIILYFLLFSGGACFLCHVLLTLED